jgi:hypothetical protein
MTDAVDKVVGGTGLAALAAAGLSWIVLVFFAPPGGSHRRYGTPLGLELTQLTQPPGLAEARPDAGPLS